MTRQRSIDSVIQVTITLEEDDWFAFQFYLEKTLAKDVKPRNTGAWFYMLMGSVIAVIVMFVFLLGPAIDGYTAGIVSAVFIALVFGFVLYVKKLRWLSAPAQGGIFTGEHHFVFDQDGIDSKGKGCSAHHDWSAVLRIARGSGLIMIFLDTTFALVFPEKKLDDPDRFFGQLSAYRQ